jgi:hypothetical protein
LDTVVVAVAAPVSAVYDTVTLPSASPPSSVTIWVEVPVPPVSVAVPPVLVAPSVVVVGVGEG